MTTSPPLSPEDRFEVVLSKTRKRQFSIVDNLYRIVVAHAEYGKRNDADLLVYLANKGWKEMKKP